jgi:predicted neuraminidase
VVGLRIRSGSLLAAFNNTEVGRNNLALAQSFDRGEHWRVIATIEQGDPGTQFSYPSLIQSENGRIHLVYAWNQQWIKHVELNEAWLPGLVE